MNTTPEPVTVVGLGNLGRALAETFLRNGHPTTVWNRSAGRAEALVAAGATVAPTAAEAVLASELVVVALLDHPAAREVLTGAAEAVRGRAVVNLTSGGPDDARHLAGWASEHGAEYLHGAVYAVPQTIGTKESTINYSGSPAVDERWRDVLNVLGEGAFLGTDAGRASGYDVAILAGMYGMLGGFMHAIAMAGAAGITATDLTPMLLSWLTDMFPAVSTFAEEIDNRDYTSAESSLAMNRSGLGTVMRASRSQGVPTTPLAYLEELIDEQVAAGHGAASLSRVVESLRSSA